MKNNEITSHHIGIAAEAIAAAQFARLDYDVSVQYGANQKEYDLVIAKGDILIKISVKGSQDGSWGLTQSFKKKDVDYHRATDIWLDKHTKNTVFCLVQFKGKDIKELPNLYLATPKEIAERLKETRNGKGDTILYEEHVWKMKSAVAYGTTEKIPNNWTFSKDRMEELIRTL
jgi:Holliday junction resolvase-like predicted endonuclease